MTLMPNDAEPGLWINPEWREDKPGTFAVVIGVSRYAHLDGGDAPAQETYGLGQLKVSALTAYQVFRWLESLYRVDGCPVAKCWLLLSPTNDELAHTEDIAQHLELPTIANCEKALGFWHHHMKNLLPTVAHDSRAIFFFSGHGLEVHQEQQILLPSDYLAPPSHNWNNAISTENLKNGLASLKVPYQFFFLDACRNDHKELRGKKISGRDILNEDEAALVSASRVAPLLYATASGQQAFQQPDPKKGISIFGQALLDGLHGTPDIELKCQDKLCSVNLYPLQSYVKQRVIELLTEAEAKVTQPVKLSGIVDNETITYLERSGITAARPEPPTPRERALSVEKSLSEVFTESRDVSPSITRGTWAADFGIGHEIFGSERVTEIWSNQVKLYALGVRDWVIDPDALVLHKIERDKDTRSYRAEISISHEDELGH